MPQAFGEAGGTKDKLDTLITPTGPQDFIAAARPTTLHAQINFIGDKARMSNVSIVDDSTNVSTVTKAKLLIIYFVFNLGLTFFNKAIMIEVRCELSLH